MPHRSLSPIAAPTLPTLALLGVATVLVFAAGCDCAGPPVGGRSCRSNSDCRATEECLDTLCRPRSTTDVGRDLDSGPGSDTPPRTLVSISVEPPVAMLTSIDGSMPTQRFTVLQHYSDGSSSAALGPSFALGDLRMGSVDVASGDFASNGAVGGETTVTATVVSGGTTLTDDATLTVTLERTIRGTGIDDAAVALFSTPAIGDASRAAGIVYPLDGAVMPQNVFPADVQWLNGASGDFFRVTLEKAHARLVAYVAYDGLNHYRADDDATRDDPSDGTTAWRGLAQTDPGTAASVHVERYEAASGMVYGGSPVSVTFAEAALVGSVYYWDIARGRIVRIDDGTATRNEFMPTPPLDLDGNHCVGCHSVSPSGRWMAGRLGGGDNIGGIFDLTTDLTGDPPPVRWPLNYTRATATTWWFSSWSPDETRMVVSYQEAAGPLRIIDPRDGTYPAVSGALPTLGTHPVWSPDGTRIAYVTNHAPGWGGDLTNGDIAMLEVLGPDSFGASTIIHTGASLSTSFPPGNADSYPTWSPDSALLAFGHGDNCRSEIPAPSTGRVAARAALYAMLPDGTGVVRLDRASGGTAGDDSFQPRFSPFQQAGYYWLSFLSRRDYGNAMVGTRGAGRQQIWVAAIRVSGVPGEDPSAVAYWLPGQNTASMNIAAYWAPRACRPDGEACTVGSECCGGECDLGAGGTFVCAPPPPDRCRREGETCTTDADCCMGMDLMCIVNVCTAGPG